MPVGPPFSPRPLAIPQDVAVRTGVYVGVGLSLVLVAWLFVANHAASLERFAAARNLVTLALLVLVAAVPVVRFLRMPAKLWVSSLIGWTIFSVTYGLLALAFSGLREHFGGFQVFVLGAVLYMIVATLAWLVRIVWRTWSEDSAHRHHPVS
ncbi:MAG: hypothetical protein ABSG69_06305 [Candidatus Acidiferrum sp.]|jgi:hypothetical protein